MVVFVNNNFSAFKLFFDEFLYKKNSFVSYAKVEENLENINNLVMSVRRFSKIDIKAYMINLKKVNKALKKELDEIYSNNKPLLEYYHIMYKARTNYTNDALKDLPLIISNSFYNDYRLDDKTPLELENSNNTIPKYSSLEKKNIREEAKKQQSLNYFLGLLKKSENKRKYESFLEKMDILLNIYPLFDENHFKFFGRVEKAIEGYEKLYKKLEEKAKLSDDYEEISLKMKIAYRLKTDDWVELLKKLVSDHFDFVFKIKESNSETMSHFNVVNKISYESYLDIIKRLKEEKEYLDDCFYKNELKPSYKFDDNYLLRFKNSLINAYYDKRFHLNVIKGDLNSYVDTAINLYSLAFDLENSVFDYYLYLTSHSRRLSRNNDVESAIIRNIYDIYSPLVSLNRFEKIRKEFGDFLAKESNEFKQKYNTELLSRRVDYGFKGMIPNISAIKIFLNERCKNFIVENCLDNIINFDDSGLYDTRNYDLEVLCEKLSIEEVLNLYGRLKSVFSNFDNSFLIPQRFICNVIYNKLYNEDETNRLDKLKNICLSYLKEEPLFL